MNKLLRTSGLFLKRNASTILTCVGGVGVVATAVMAVKATPKALERIEQAETEKGEPLTKLEVVNVAGPAYIPTVLTGTATIACIFGANILNKRQQASLMSAYALLDNSYKEYVKKVGELYGEEANANVRAEIAKDHYVDDYGDETEYGENEQLFYDWFSDQYFVSTMEKVIQAEYNLNKKISLLGGAFLNEFYEALDIPPIDGGESLGWSIGHLMSETWTDWLDFEHEKIDIGDGVQCVIVKMRTDPVVDYEYY
jgi:hypothetical protein